jgi:hypothetical protein
MEHDRRGGQGGSQELATASAAHPRKSHGTTVTVVGFVPSGHGLGSLCTLRAIREVHPSIYFLFGGGPRALYLLALANAGVETGRIVTVRVIR